MMKAEDSPLMLAPEVHELLCRLQQAPQVAAAGWLVGGTIRDLLEDRAPLDIDIAFAGDLTPQVKTWAKEQGGSWFWLDKKRNQSRVIFPGEGLQFDFAPLRAENIIADLRLRDFTLNAMALPLTALSENLTGLIDPLNGRKDLQLGLLRSCGTTVLSDDPLRILKGIRHHALRGWQFDPQTADQISRVATRLPAVAGERIRNELGQILASERFLPALELMARLGILECLFPGINQVELRQALEPLRARITQLEERPLFSFLLHRQIEEGLSCKAILILAVLQQRSDCRDGVSWLRCSTRSRSLLGVLGRGPIALDHLRDCETSRIAALKLEALGTDPVEQLLFALIHLDYGDLDLAAAQYIESYRQALCRGRIRDLLDGREIIALTGLASGRIVGELQSRLKAAEITGEISGKESASRWLKQQFSD